MDEYSAMILEPIVVHRYMEEKQVVLIDCRFSLQDSEAGEREYRVSHVPGALYAHLERDLSGPKGTAGGRHPLPDTEAFARFLSRAGVTADTHVIAYDTGGEMAARLWWLLRYFGHALVSVMQGGYDAWLAQGFPVTDALPTTAPATVLDLQPQSAFLVTRAQVQARIKEPGESFPLLDARALPRYRGDIEPLDPRAGHLPGASCVFWGEALSAPATYKSADELRAHYAFLEGQGTPVVYCGSGVTACVNVLAMRAVQIPALLYAGSFSDWCQDPLSEVVQGDDPLALNV